MKENRNKINNVPNLRFPEFEEEWVEKRFGKIASDFSYGMNSAAIDFDGTNKYIRITDIDKNTRKFLPNPLTSPDGTIDEKYKLKVGDIVFARTGASVGKSYLYNEKDGNLYYAGFLIKAKVDKANENFVFYQTLRSNYNKWVKVMSMRSGQPGINAKEYHSLKLNLPAQKEQQKIATFISIIDERIQTQNKILRHQESLMKGLMQQIFSQKLRFKNEDGNDFQDWKEKEFGEVFNFINTNSYSRNLLNYEKGTIKNIHYGDIHTKFSLNFDVEKEQVPFINTDVNIANIKEDQFCIEGDLVIADASEDYNDIGKAIEIINLSGQKLVAGLHTYIARENNKIEKGFKAYLMKAEYVRTQIKKIASGISVLGISKGNLSLIKLFIPQLEEQQKIANFLSSIDKMTENEKQILAQYQQQKKYLLQNLFI